MLDGWQRNKSAAQYHFGDRDGLIRAILAIGTGPINKRRFQMLLEYDRSERRPDLRQLVKCLIPPLAIETLSDPSSYYARFLAQNQTITS